MQCCIVIVLLSAFSKFFIAEFESYCIHELRHELVSLVREPDLLLIRDMNILITLLIFSPSQQDDHGRLRAQ